MTKRFTIFLALLVAVSALCISPGASSAQSGKNSTQAAPVKHVLLEEFTGSWCGWCPRGIFAIQQIEAKHPGLFITASIHNQDPMTTPEGDAMQAWTVSPIPGFPIGWVDRTPTVTPFTTDGADPVSWDTVVTRELAKPAVVDVQITNSSFDPATSTVTATVTATFAAAYSGDLRFNLYVVEDSVSGPAGTTWDQHNYLTGQTAYKTNPFYALPPVVPNYQHMHVVRAMVGGTWGIEGEIPATVAAGGTYSHTFTYQLPDARMKVDNMRLIGLVFKYSDKDAKSNEILNAIQTPLTTLPSITGVTITTANPYITVARNGTTDQAVTIKNNGTKEITMNLLIDSTNSVFPNAWSATLSPTSVKVQPGASQTVTLTVSTSSWTGYFSVDIAGIPTADGEVGRVIDCIQNGLGANTKYAAFIPSSNPITADPAFGSYAGDYAEDFAAIPYNTGTLAAYPPSTFDVGVFADLDVIDYDVTKASGLPPAAQYINSMLDAGKKVIVTSNDGLYNTYAGTSPLHAAASTPAAKAFYTMLGLKYVGQTPSYNTSGQYVPFQVTGVDQDPVGNGIDVTCQYFGGNAYMTDVFLQLNNNSTETMYFESDVTSPAAVRCENGGKRVAYFDFPFWTMQDASMSDQLVTQTIKWLLTPAGVEATASVPTSFSASPNPFSAATSVSYTAAANESGVQMSLVDILGREVAKIAPERTGSNLYNATVNGANLAAGSYRVVVRSSEGMHTLPVMITR